MKTRHIAGTSQAEVMLNSKKIKPIALAIMELLHACLSVSQQKFSKIFLKFCIYFLKAFWVDLKALLVLVLPELYCLISICKNQS